MAWEETTVPPRRMPLRMADPPRRTRGKCHGKVCCEAWDRSWRGRATEASESLGAHSYFSPKRD